MQYDTGMILGRTPEPEKPPAEDWAEIHIFPDSLEEICPRMYDLMRIDEEIISLSS